MEKIATSFCLLEVLRRRYTYVDKTDLLRRLGNFFETLAAQYKGDSRPVTLVGVNFRTANRNIDAPLLRRSDVRLSV